MCEIRVQVTAPSEMCRHPDGIWLRRIIRSGGWIHVSFAYRLSELMRQSGHHTRNWEPVNRESWVAPFITLPCKPETIHETDQRMLPNHSQSSRSFVVGAR